MAAGPHHGKRHRHEGRGHRSAPAPAARGGQTPPPPARVTLDLVLVADTAGTLDAVKRLALEQSTDRVEVRVALTGLGGISHSHLHMAVTASRLILGFQVEPLAGVAKEARALGVEVRLYEVVSGISEDLGDIVATFDERPPEEEVLGRGTVIALFPSSRHDAILGCELTQGRFSLGDRYRIIGVAGPVHEGRLESLHVGPDVVREAPAGRQVGVKVHGFQKARVGDVVETFRPAPHGLHPAWTPTPGVRRR